MSDLITIPEVKGGALALFSSDFETTIAPLLKPIGEQVEAFLREPPDATIESGREAIKEFGRKLVKSRTLLESVGKSVADEIKRLPKIVDANRKAARDQLEEWERLVRADLEAWETREAERIAGHVKAIAAITELGTRTLPGDLALTAVEIRAELDALSRLDAAPEEFADEYRIAIAAARERLGAQLIAREQYERGQAELAALRASQARQKAIDDEREAKAELERAELARKAANEQAEIERQARERAEKDREIANAALALAESNRRAAEAEASRLREAEADRLAKEAREREQAEATKRAEETRERNKNHQAAVNRKAAEAIAASLTGRLWGVDARRAAQLIVAAIAKGEIPHVSINY